MVSLVRCRESIVLIQIFFLINDVLNFRIFWSVLVTVKYINPEINIINDFTSSLPRINRFDSDYVLCSNDVLKFRIFGRDWLLRLLICTVVV